MLRFLSIGSGSSGNCYLLYSETDAIMIDCGVGTRTLKKHFVSYGLQLSMIRNILVTHDHADHVKSVGAFSSSQKIPVYATRDIFGGIERNWCIKKKVVAELAHYIEKGKSYQIGEFQVTPFAVPHDSTDCIGYFIEHGGVRFTLITDCGHITDEIASYVNKANYLVIEANHEPEVLANGPYPQFLKDRICSQIGHLSNSDCAKLIAENATPRLRYVWLCHLSDENNHPELAKKTIEAELKNYGILVGKDFQMEVLKRKQPSGFLELTLE